MPTISFNDLNFFFCSVHSLKSQISDKTKDGHFSPERKTFFFFLFFLLFFFLPTLNISLFVAKTLIEGKVRLGQQ